MRNLVRELLLELIQTGNALGQFRFVHKKDGDAIADRVAQSADLRDQLIALLFKRRSRQRAAHDFQNVGVDGVGFTHNKTIVSQVFLPDALDISTQSLEGDFHAFVAAIQVIDTIDGGCAFGRKTCEDQPG